MYKILIRPLEKKDADISWKWRNDSEIWEFTGRRPNISITPEIELNWIEKVLTEDNSRRFAITVDGKYIGNIQLTNITVYDAEYHIFLGDKNYWGKEISFSSTQQIIRYAKNVLKLNKIYLKVNPQNVKAIRLYEKSGFEIVSDEIKMILTLDKMVRPMVSIFCMVYNHEPFLRECLEGFLMQKCNFDYEIVVGEDCSKDESRAILLDYAQKYPGKFKLLLHNQNIGAHKNQQALFENCLGKYIAICEGDDYWTDPLKLQKQVGLLEANQEVVMTFSSRIIQEADLTETDSTCEERFWSKNDIYAYGTVFPTQTMVGRNYQFELIKFISLFPDSFGSDKIIGYFYCLNGRVQSIEDVTAVYRHNGLGVWSKFSNEEKLVLHIDESLKFLTTIVKEKIDESISLEELKHLLFLRIINNNLDDPKFLKFLFKKYNLSNKLKLIAIGNRVKSAIKTTVKILYK